MYDSNSKVEDLLNQEGVILLYQIPPELNPQLPPKERCSKSDSNHGINAQETTKCVMNFLVPQKSTYSYYVQIKAFMIPRVLWVNQSWTCRQVHHEVFKSMRHNMEEFFKNEKVKAPFVKQGATIDEKDE